MLVEPGAPLLSGGSGAHSTSCAPSHEHVRVLGGALAAGPSQERLGSLRGGSPDRQLRFYLHETGAFDLGDTVACYLRAINSTLSIDDMDERLTPDDAEHLTDLWLANRLRRHPQRTHDADEAELHIVGAPLATSWRAAAQGIGAERMPHHQALHAQCGGYRAHADRMDRIASELERMPAFQRHHGRDFLVAITHYNPVRILGRRLLAMLQAGPSWMATADKDFRELRTLRPHSDGVVVLPYKAHYMLEAAAWRKARTAAFVPSLDFMFHGCTSRTSVEGSLRGSFLSMLRELPATSLTGLSDSCDYTYASDFERTRQASRQTAAAFLNSSYCFVLPGDTPTSRRLFDSVAAGCIPLIMGDADKIASNLPFHSSIDWSELALFGGSLACNTREGSSELAPWLRRLAREKQLHRLRSRLQETFRSSLSYTTGDGLVSALLKEVSRLPLSTTPQPTPTAAAELLLAVPAESPEPSPSAQERSRRGKRLSYSLKAATRFVQFDGEPLAAVSEVTPRAAGESELDGRVDAERTRLFLLSVGGILSLCILAAVAICEARSRRCRPPRSKWRDHHW